MAYLGFSFAKSPFCPITLREGLEEVEVKIVTKKEVENGSQIWAKVYRLILERQEATNGGTEIRKE